MERFPTEILEQIFSYLDQYDLENCSTVCHRWEIILAPFSKKLLVFNECFLKEDTEPGSLFQNPVGIYHSLKLGIVVGDCFGTLTETVTKLIMKDSSISYHDALSIYFKNVTDLSLTYPKEVKQGQFPNVKVLRIHHMMNDPEQFFIFLSSFTEVKEIYIESIYRISDSIWKFIDPVKDKIKGLPYDAIKSNGSQFCAFRDLDTFNPSRIITDWRMYKQKLVEEKLYLEQPAFILRNKQEYEDNYESYLMSHPRPSLEMQIPFNLPFTNINSLKLHLGDEVLSNFKSLVNCKELELCAYVFGDVAVPCFFGHQTIPNRIQHLTLRLGRKKRCAKCWKYMMSSCDLDTFHFHGIMESFMFTLIMQQKYLRKLTLQLSPTDDSEPLNFKWLPMQYLESLTIHFKDEFDLIKIKGILESQLNLKSLELKGNGDFTGLVDTFVKMQSLQFLSLYVLENLHDLNKLMHCKMLKRICFDDTVTKGYTGEPFDPQLMFDNCPKLQKIKWSYREWASKLWRRTK